MNPAYVCIEMTYNNGEPKEVFALNKTDDLQRMSSLIEQMFGEVEFTLDTVLLSEQEYLAAVTAGLKLA